MPTDDLMALEDDDLLERTARKPRRGGFVAGLALLLALVAVGLSGWQWWQAGETAAVDPELEARLESLRQVQSRQADRLGALESSIESRLEAAAAGSDTAIEALQSDLADQQSRGRALEQELESQASLARSLQQAVESMQARLTAAENRLAAQAPARVDEPVQLDLAGVDFLLRLAPERLTLFHDLRSADEALALADARLAALDNPMYIALRRDIADARQSLAEADLPNPVEISARLDAVQRQLAGLEFKSAGSATATTLPSSETAESGAEEAGWWDRLKASMSGLVTVRRAADDELSRRTLADKDILRQGLWMQIEGARLALMRHDQAAWADALDRASRLLERWFDPSSDAWRTVQEELAALSSLEIAPDLPDISGPWAQLQVIRQARAVPAPAEVPPSPSPQPAAEEGDGTDGGSGVSERAPDESG